MTWKKQYGLARQTPSSPLIAYPNKSPLEVIRMNPKSHAKESVALRWGLIPYWAQDAKIGQRRCHARRESVWEKPSFKRAFDKQRCIIPAANFLESPKGKKGRVNFAIRRKAGRPLSLAGLWESWKLRQPAPNAGEVLQTRTLITCDSHSVMGKIYERMPVVLNGPQIETWLNPKSSLEDLKAILKTVGDDVLVAEPWESK